MDLALLPRQIRLLHLQAGDGPNIRCHASVADLASATPYEALSYTWGLEPETEPVFIDGKTFRVKQNLHAALLQLRSTERELVLWVDALCIDQNHPEERNMSVRMMREIYACATQVVIWLGVETETDKNAFVLFERFDKVFEKHGFIHVGHEYEKYGLPEPESKEYEAAAALFRRPYFTRIWIVQELVKASQSVVRCGALSMPWKLLFAIVQSLSSSGMLGNLQIEHSARGALTVAMIGGLRKSADARLLPLLVLTRHFKSTDPRDRIYALLGIAKDPGQTGVVIDYASKTEDLFSKLAIHSMVSESSLAILGNASLWRDSDLKSHIPTWVPDWTHPNDRRVCLSVLDSFKASGASRSVISFSDDKRVLKVRGTKMDTIAHVTITTRKYRDVENPSEPDEMFGMILPFPARIRFEKKLTLESEALAELCTKYPEGQSREEAYWRTVACDITTDGTRMSIGHGSGYRYWQLFMRAADLEGNFDMQKHMSDVKEYVARMKETDTPLGAIEHEQWIHAVTIHSVARNICVTSEGRIGLVSCETLPGDIVCVLLGGRVPFVLRPAADGRFKLVGECYMHGVMDGEVVAQKDVVYDDFEII